MLIQCPCGTKLQVKDSLAGKKVRCPTCKEVFLVAEPGQEKTNVQTGKSEQHHRSDNVETDAIQESRPRKKVHAQAKNQVRYDSDDESIQAPPNNLKWIAGLVCIVLGVLLFFGGLSNLFLRDGPSLSDPSGLGVSRAVGGFLPSMLMFILGAWLLSKKKERG